MFKYFRSYRIFFRKYGSVDLSITKYTNNKSVEIDRTLLITHGLLGSKQNWNSVAKGLNLKIREVVTIDLRNHGDSAHVDNISIEAMSEDIHRLIVSNKYTKPAFLGHSLGGKVAMYLALSQRQLLSSLVVVDIAPAVTPQIQDFKSYIETMLVANIDQNQSLSANRKAVEIALTKCVQDPDIRGFLLRNLVQDDITKVIKWRVNLRALNSNLDELIQFPIPPHGIFEGPTLFVAGAKSDYIREEQWPLIKRLFPLAQLQVIQDAGHWVQADKPRELMTTLCHFLSNDAKT